MKYDTDVRVGDLVEILDRPLYLEQSRGRMIGRREIVRQVQGASSCYLGFWNYEFEGELCQGRACKVRVLERDGKPVERCADCNSIVPHEWVFRFLRWGPGCRCESCFLKHRGTPAVNQVSKAPAVPEEAERPRCTDCGAPATEYAATSPEAAETLSACVYCAHRWQGAEPGEDPAKSSWLDWRIREAQPEVTEDAWQTATSEGP